MESQSVKPSPETRQMQDEQLLQRMAERDEAALGEFYDQYHRLVYSLVLRVTGSADEAEDVVVDIFWQVWLHAARYQPERAKVVTWLLMMARSRALDRRRQMRRQENIAQAAEIDQMEKPEAGPDPEAESFMAIRQRDMRTALEALPEPQRRAIELAYYGGLSQSEIAAALDEPLGTIKTRIRAGMTRLREELRDYL